MGGSSRDNLLKSIDVLIELERLGIAFEAAGDDNVKVLCPFHDDKTPSCSISVTEALFRCHSAGCRTQGDILTFIAGVLKTTRALVLTELGTRYDLAASKFISSSTVERHHEALSKSKFLLRELTKRGVGDDLIRKYRLGACRGRVTIPIPDSSGQVVNIRRYRPGAPGADKMKNTSGHGQIRLYPVEQLSHDRIVICGGEMKAIVMANVLNDDGIGAITTTGGEGHWHPAFTAALQGKEVYVCFDVDAEGIAAAKELCKLLDRRVEALHSIAIPLDSDKYPHGDVNDWIGQAGATHDQVLEVVLSAPMWITINDDEPITSEPSDIEFKNVTDVKNVGRRIRTEAMVSAIDVTPYVVPNEVSVDCDRKQPGCVSCPIYTKDYNGSPPTECISPESPYILQMIGATIKVQREAISGGLHIPPCKSVKFKARSYHRVEDVRLTARLGLENDSSGSSSMQPAMLVGEGCELNESYVMSGRTLPHPRSQQSVMLVSDAKPVKDALSTYDPQDKDLKPLSMFNPKVWTLKGLKTKLDELYADLEANVTRIYISDMTRADTGFTNTG